MYSRRSGRRSPNEHGDLPRPAPHAAPPPTHPAPPNPGPRAAPHQLTRPRPAPVPALRAGLPHPPTLPPARSPQGRGRREGGRGRIRGAGDVGSNRVRPAGGGSIPGARGTARATTYGLRVRGVLGCGERRVQPCTARGRGASRGAGNGAPSHSQPAVAIRRGAPQGRGELRELPRTARGREVSWGAGNGASSHVRPAGGGGASWDAGNRASNRVRPAGGGRPGARGTACPATVNRQSQCAGEHPRGAGNCASNHARPAGGRGCPGVWGTVGAATRDRWVRAVRWRAGTARPGRNRPGPGRGRSPRPAPGA